jgi:Starch binding domain
VIHLRVPYPTRWGQNLVVTGAGAALGNWEVKRGHWMSCHHLADQLVWEAVLSVPLVPRFTYKYVVVNELLETEATEERTRKLELPPDLEAGHVVDVFDVWQAGTNIG